MASDPTRALSTPPITVPDPQAADWDSVSASEAYAFGEDLTAEARSKSANAQEVEAVRELRDETAKEAEKAAAEAEAEAPSEPEVEVSPPVEDEAPEFSSADEVPPRSAYEDDRDADVRAAATEGLLEPSFEDNVLSQDGTPNEADETDA